MIQDDGATYEHIDLAQNNGGPFDPAAYGGDAAKALAVRQAFLHAVPRQDIVDRLIIPLNENAEVRNAQAAVPGEPFYDELVAEQRLRRVRRDRRRAGQADPRRRRHRHDDADRGAAAVRRQREPASRQSEYELIRESVAQAGFDLVDASGRTGARTLPNTSVYDAALFGWQTTAIAVADSMPNYVTDGINNFYGYSNPDVDALADELNVTSDAARQDEILIEVEQNLFADAFGLPIFQHPSITAYNSTYVDGVSNIAIAPTVFFNVWDWKAGRLTRLIRPRRGGAPPGAVTPLRTGWWQPALPARSPPTALVGDRSGGLGVAVYIARRLVAAFFILIGASFIVYMLMTQAGDPLAFTLSITEPDPAGRRHEDRDRDAEPRPVPRSQRYLDWLRRLLFEGDFGLVSTTQQPVWDELKLRIPLTHQARRWRRRSCRSSSASPSAS